ncbi:MAG TPA: branched-chain amino acid ABC transporter permease [Desulfatiglandales bacterium]|nr:branched-chain amino acid ABC transporter permease [Desulfatiglandales bacterium]
MIATAEFFQYLLNGISQGCVYILLASGLTLIFGILNVPNFAQGHLYMVGAYFGFYMVMSLGMNYWTAMVLATVALGLVGLLLYKFIFFPIRDAPEVNLFVAAMALLMIIEGAALYFFGTETKWFVVPYSRRVVTFGDFALPLQRVIVILGTLAVMTALHLFIKKTTIGATLEATAQQRDGAMLCGIKVARVSALAFMIGTGLAGIAGVLIGPAVLLEPTMGMGPLLVAFSAVVFGGMGSIAGAMLGAFILGLAESLASGYISATYSLAFVFGIMILMLLFRPQGLLGREVWRP